MAFSWARTLNSAGHRDPSGSMGRGTSVESRGRAAWALGALGSSLLALSCAGAEPRERSEAPGPAPSGALADTRASAPPLEASAASASLEAAPPVASGATAVSAPPASSGPCPPDMVDVGTVCIDRYEAPNVKGDKPLRMRTSQEGDAWCGERGKRLCSEDEWVRACEGPKGKPFPYGSKYDAGRCNDDGKFLAPNWKLLGGWPSEAAQAEVERLDQSEPSGARDGCRSDEGVFDLTGNVGEWVRRTQENETNYTHVVKGCFWGRCFRPPHTPSCEYVNYAHPAGYRSYELGFRCCKARAR